MLVWILFAVMASAVVAALTYPLLRPNAQRRNPTEADQAVYRDQLSELASERERGAIAAPEAEAARAEIARRILRSRAEDDSGQDKTRRRGASVAPWTALALAALIPLASLGLYLALGAPNLGDQPHAARLDKPIEDATAVELLARVEARLQENPDDARGWEIVGPFYIRLGRYAEAATAFERAIALAGPSPARLTGVGEATIRANEGVVTDKARRAYEQLRVLEPERTDAQFWLALAQEQDGDLRGALAAYRTIAANPAADPRWRKALKARIAALESQLPKTDAPSLPSPRPSLSPDGQP